MSSSINTFKLVILALVMSTGVIGLSSTVKAVDGVNTGEPQTNTTEPKPPTVTEPRTVTKDRPTTTTTKTEQARVYIAKLEAAKLNICQRKETEIKNTLARISDRGKKRISTLSEITTKVEAFYVTKGKILNNYDQLVADVDTAKLAASEEVAKVMSHSTAFACNSDNPKSTLSEFKSDNQSLNTVLKNYKTALKNLIVGVKSVQGVTSSEANKNTTKEQ